MKLTDDQKKMFAALAESKFGPQVADYLSQLSRFVCDARNWREKDTRESSTRAAEVIDEYIGKHLRKNQNATTPTVYPYE